MRDQVLKIMGYAFCALSIPLAGNLLIEGWNWTPFDFIFAWVFWVGTALTILIVVRRYPIYGTYIGIAIFNLFVFLWGLLATG